ncbi:MAG: hypothetical protein LQ343_003049 [Gyalolechia ehrenbergii]|nr:MAG: hypothetical protein LQ343_003049 [Gyalolechia ehrenbergii]
MDQKPQDPQENTRILPVDVNNIGDFIFKEPNRTFLGDWEIRLSRDNRDAVNLLQAVEQLQTSSIPVAFPTETVYGLGADATRDDAVLGIYKAKQRPADNPLIIHISSLTQLRQLLASSPGLDGASSLEVEQDPIPAIYHPLISRFWPGPLSILLPLPEKSPLAGSVTGNLSTFAVRMPSSRLALALINLARVPIAAPSANASTRPSTTTAAHVLHDLNGRIKLIIDGGPCLVGVESTVVDGLVNPPVILRPGGVSIEKLRQCSGWEKVELGYRDGAETSAPRAPGMKYKHYSPTARVILVNGQLSVELLTKYLREDGKVGIATTTNWKDEDLVTSGTCMTNFTTITESRLRTFKIQKGAAISLSEEAEVDGQILAVMASQPSINREHQEGSDSIHVVCTDLGTEATSIAQNLFSALRELDLQGTGVIFVEAIGVSEGHAAAAVMNRLRKAAELEIKS